MITDRIIEKETATIANVQSLFYENRTITIRIRKQNHLKPSLAVQVSSCILLFSFVFYDIWDNSLLYLTRNKNKIISKTTKAITTTVTNNNSLRVDGFYISSVPSVPVTLLAIIHINYPTTSLTSIGSTLLSRHCKPNKISIPKSYYNDNNDNNNNIVRTVILLSKSKNDIIETLPLDINDDNINNNITKTKTTTKIKTVPSRIDPEWISRKMIDINKNNKNDTNDNSDNTNMTPFSKQISKIIQIEDTVLWIGDMISILIAFQLVGLIDVVNNPVFVQNGGWFQPMSTILNNPETTTLPLFVQRFCINSILYNFVTILLLKGTAYETKSITSTNTLLQTSIQILFVFIIMKFIIATVFFFVASGSYNNNFNNIYTNNNINNEWIEWHGIVDYLYQPLRDCYFVFLGTSSFRYLLYRFNRYQED